MNLLDIVILIPIGWMAWIGFKKGFIIEVFTLLALFVGLYAGIHFSEAVSNAMKTSFGWQSEYLPVISFTLTFLAVGAMLFFAGKTLEKMVKITMLSPLNKVAGLFFAILKASYLVSISLILLSAYDKANKFIPLKVKNDSLLYHPMLGLSEKTIPGFDESSFFKSDDTTGVDLTLDQLLRAKKLADSLGIDAQDAISLKKVYDEYEKQP